MVGSDKKQLEFNKLDILSGIALVGGSLASILTQKVVLAVIPLSLAVGLEIFNRQQELVKLKAQTRKEFLKNDSLLEEKFKTQQANIVQIEEKAVSQIDLFKQEHNYSLIDLAQKLQETRKQVIHLSRQTQKLNLEQEQIDQVVNKLSKMEELTPQPLSNEGAAEFYYERGFGYEQLTDWNQAIKDYTQAIALNAEYVEAYYSRGLIYSKLDDPKSAIQDLRQAAKLYFKQNNLECYRQTRLLCQELYNLRPSAISPESSNSSSIKLGQLFSVE